MNHGITDFIIVTLLSSVWTMELLFRFYNRYITHHCMNHGSTIPFSCFIFSETFYLTARTYHHISSNDFWNDELERIWKETAGRNWRIVPTLAWRHWYLPLPPPPKVSFCIVPKWKVSSKSNQLGSCALNVHSTRWCDIRCVGLRQELVGSKSKFLSSLLCEERREVSGGAMTR
jgi:hypothetical protein